MFSVGLVLSAGGAVGDPWHSGVLSTLLTQTGWDARDADLVVGTSAGAIAATGLRADVSPIDRAADHRGEPISDEAAAILGRIVTPWEEHGLDRDWRPMSPRMSLRAAWPPWRPEPARLVMGAIPRGTRSAAPLAARMNELAGVSWPERPTWVVAVRMSDGRRIVFGRDDVKGDIGEAVHASSAVPGVYAPARIGRREYVDGAVHSATNADLVAPLAFDMVVVSSCASAVPAARTWTGDTKRAWFGRKLDDEVDTIRRTGTPVLVVEPGEAEIEQLADRGPGVHRRAVDAGVAATHAALDRPEGSGVRELLARAAAEASRTRR